MGRRLVNLANVMVRHFPGGLGMVMVATMIFSEVSGSSAGSRRPAARPLLLVMVAMLAVVGFIPEITLCVPRWVYGK